MVLLLHHLWKDYVSCMLVGWVPTKEYINYSVIVKSFLHRPQNRATLALVPRRPPNKLRLPKARLESRDSTSSRSESKV